VLQTAAFLWLHKGDEYKDLYKGITGARIVYELYRRISASDNLELFQVLLLSFFVPRCIMFVRAFVCYQIYEHDIWKTNV